MRYVTSTLAACLLASTVGVFAQEQQAPPQPPPPSAGEPAPPLKGPVPKETLTGCVGQAKTTDGGTAYILNKAEGGSAAIYLLGGPSQSEVTANLNKKVEVTGPVLEPAATGKEGEADTKILRPPLMLVESVKVVAESCA